MAGKDVDNTQLALALAEKSNLQASTLDDSDIANIENLKARAMAPIGTPEPRKQKTRVKLVNQADSEIGYIADDMNSMEQAGVFSAVGSAAELKKVKSEIDN